MTTADSLADALTTLAAPAVSNPPLSEVLRNELKSAARRGPLAVGEWRSIGAVAPNHVEATLSALHAALHPFGLIARVAQSEQADWSCWLEVGRL